MTKASAPVPVVRCEATPAEELRSAAVLLRRRAAGTGSEVDVALADHLDAVAASAEWLDAKVSGPLLRLARLILAGGGS